MSLKNLSATTKIPKLLRNKLNNKKIKQIYKKFEETLNIDQNFIVAVSGGPDSLALAFLSKIYGIKKGLIIKFFIVDHKLRIESTNEAKTVKKILKKYSINAKILTWKKRFKPSNNIQSRAREKRYELLFCECKKLKINNILLGHHLDDLFENFFIRLLRGSGLKGLVSLDKKTKIQNMNLFRPLLNQKKRDLVFLSKFVFDFYVKDPSNKNEKFQRVRIRKFIKKLQDDGLNKEKFIQTIQNLKHSNKVIDFYTNENLKKNTFFDNKKKQIVLNHDFFNQPHEIILRSLSDSIKLVGQKFYPTRGKKVDQIIKNIQKNTSIRLTLGGCIIEKINQTVIISKEI